MLEPTIASVFEGEICTEDKGRWCRARIKRIWKRQSRHAGLTQSKIEDVTYGLCGDVFQVLMPSCNCWQCTHLEQHTTTFYFLPLSTAPEAKY